VLLIQQPLVVGHVEWLKGSRPGCTPTEIVSALEHQYIAAVTAGGAAAGGSAAAPGVGTGVSLALSAAETLTTLEATVLYVLGVAEVHGIAVTEVERRRTLLLVILLGDSGTKFFEKASKRTGQHWAKKLINSIPMSQINAINGVLGPRFVTKYGTRQGILVLGRLLPFGIGLGIGAGGNFVIARSVVAGARRAFGTSPATFPQAQPSAAGIPVPRHPSEPAGVMA